jgi:hypothetical protein
MKFTAAFEEMKRREYARLAAAVTPRIEAFCSMTFDELGDQLASMFERLGHTVITTRPELVTERNGRKYVIAWATPTDHAPVKTPALKRLRDAVVAANAVKGFYVTTRSFTPEAEYFASTAPINTIDGAELIKDMQRSRRGLLLGQDYKVVCQQCGEIVQHRLDNDEARACANDHLVAPCWSAGDFRPMPQAPTPFRQPAPANPRPAFTANPSGPHPGGSGPVIRPRNMGGKAQRRRAVRAHNQQRRLLHLLDQQDEERG